MNPELQPFGRALIVFGVILTGFGVVLLLAPKLPWLGHLPGDIVIQRDRFVFSLPLGSCLLASLLLSLLLWIVGRFRQ
ncbi:MAG: DUF2905 domain-containing protein [Candidatus Omnitrophica bacterium]|nr:DUF2905 domain-containing protein [Candidatus Omnitrophota bacterium]